MNFNELTELGQTGFISPQVQFWLFLAFAAGFAIKVQTPGIGKICVDMDDYFIDGLIWTATAIPRGLALALRGFQNGAMQSYALTMVGGVAIALLLVMWM